MNKLLVIDDDFLWVANVRDKLTQHGFAIHHTPNALEGLEWARALLPDIIILDLLFPQQPVRGEDILMTLKQDERTRGIPIIIYSIKGFDHATREFISRYSLSPIVPRESAAQGHIIIGHKWEMQELENYVLGLTDPPKRARVIRVGTHALELGEGYR